ncbi:SNF5-domain-containing protein [Patellaria atrata CBS 101060]|uniref:SNF5-domain-containing protein n=1 Tax=Patellaria atrata CBS 101060 TaxID=1346257 RepID=A0A9P4S4L8_9PEZI|nr:SNF5-domain-containing protein [Patellaria atrata CBS 101060]
MLSPVATTEPPSASAQNTPSTQQAQSAPSMSNGSISEGAVQVPNSDNLRSGTDGRDAIREGKEKAKAVLAASGLTLPEHEDTAPSKPNITPTPTAPENANVNMNGASPSRKRSRSGSRIPVQPAPESEKEHEQPNIHDYLLNQYVLRDSLHSVAMNEQSERIRKLFKDIGFERDYYNQVKIQRQSDPGSVFGRGYGGYGNGRTDARTANGVPIVYPAQRKRAGNRRTRQLHVSRKDAATQAEQLEELVPVRLDIEFDKIKLRDTFTWNLHDRVIKPELFAETMVEDFKIPPEAAAPIAHHINREIQEQIQDFYPHVFIEEEPLDPHLPYFAYKNDEMRILIKLNITIGQLTLMDQFEWEINNPLNSPEEFARLMAAEMSLSGEFATAIAHSIREQCQMFTKSLYITGHPFDGRPIEDGDVRDSFLPSPLPSVFRPQQAAKDYTPYLYELNEAELERAELSIMREQRRQKRSVNRRGGPALPDLKDRQRTVRSLLVSNVIPGAVESIEESRLFKLTRSVSGKSKRVSGRGEDEESDESDSDQSVPGSPAVSQITTGGTARTRGIRGAAAAAQVAMRANTVRSATPEVSSHHHETRTSSRSLRANDIKEDSSVPDTLIVKLKISKDKLRQVQNKKPGQNLLSTPRAASQGASLTNSAASSMPPPPSPAPPSRTTPNPPQAQSNTETPSNTTHQWQYTVDGRVDAPYPAAPPPPWLSDALNELKQKYPNDDFEAAMRHTAVDRMTGQQIRMDPLPPGTPLPANVKYQYLPRIRCNDCPGKLYTAGPGLTVENFEVHLKNRGHKAAVDARRRAGSQGH